jgi:hypothetical protein
MLLVGSATTAPGDPAGARIVFFLLESTYVVCRYMGLGGEGHVTSSVLDGLFIRVR